MAYTGQESLSEEVRQDLQDCLNEVNDPVELVSLQVLKQGDIYSAVAQGVEGASIDVEISLFDWGQVREPYAAFYGQMAASDIASLYESHKDRLFAPNIRMFLGTSEVNESIIETIATEPQNFWYFNNGITALCRAAVKKPLGGSSKESGIFECNDLRIVNGAQTVGAIAAAASIEGNDLEAARVAIRIVSLEDCPVGFGQQITRYNNTQNRIDKRDFVALDPEQERLRGELQLEGIQYVYKSGDLVASNLSGFDLTEASVARACADADAGLAVQAKREIGKLWDDINSAPYRTLFNPSLHGPTMWRQVLILRVIEEKLVEYRKSNNGRERLLAVHGNRLLAHLVMSCLPNAFLSSGLALTDDERSEIRSLVDHAYGSVHQILSDHYPDAYLASLFKNLTKCRFLKSQFTCL